MSSSLRAIDGLLSSLLNIAKDYSVEICIDSVESAHNAWVAGADRVELCSSLISGGLTPSKGTVITVLQSVPGIDVHVMLRPRGGDFLYSRSEMDVLLSDLNELLTLKQSGQYANLKGVVSGFLDRKGNVDAHPLRLCLDKIKGSGLDFTFHRAFDMSNDAVAALQLCLAHGVHRILTSGFACDAASGLKCIKAMIRHCQEQGAGNRIEIACGGGLTAENIGAVVNAENPEIKHIHGTFRKVRRGAMQFRKSGIAMGARSVNGSATSEYTKKSR